MAKRGRKGGHEKAGGRAKGTPNKVTKAIAETARQHGGDAIEVLRVLMADKGQPGAVRIAAANSILDRGYGKPPQNISDDGTIKWPDIRVTFVRVKAGDGLSHDGEALTRLEAAGIK